MSSALANVCLWPFATDRILVADHRFRGITDMAGAAASRTRTRVTQSGHAGLNSPVVQCDHSCEVLVPYVTRAGDRNALSFKPA
jgi:hypothetical protein